MVGQTISHYLVLDELGSGGMGTVYLAEHTLLGRRVAIKTLNVEPGKQHYGGRFLREARAASRLNHPNIAAVYDYGETPDGRPFIVMELVEGETLADMIGGDGLAPGRAVEIAEKIAEALAEAHSLGIAHRDIKPANVAVSPRAGVKVLDFGLAKQVRAAHEDDGGAARALAATETCEDVIIGTPSYLSPEQALGLPVDERCDLFSLGAVLYECLTGRLAFPGESAAAVRSRVVRDDPPPPSRVNPLVPPELDRVTLKALAKRPEQRYQSAEELLTDLRAVRSALPREPMPGARRAKAPAPHPARTSALAALSGALARPRLLATIFLSTFASALLIVWGGTSWVKGPRVPPPPPPQALRLYERGVESLRNGSFHTASLTLQEALRAGGQFPLAHARLAEAWTELDYTDRAKDEIIRAGQLVEDRSALPPLDALYLQAITDTVERDYEKAVEGYRRIAEQSPGEMRAAALLDVGRAYEKSDKLEEAVSSFEEAARLDPNYAAAFLRLGVTYGRKPDMTKATAAFAEAERLYQTSGNLEGLTEALYQRGALLNKHDRLGEARQVLGQALDKARMTGNVSQQILALLQLSSVSFGQGDVAGARGQVSDAVDLAQALGMEHLTTRGLIDLGYLYFSAGDYAGAEAYFKRALEFARNNRGRRNEARALLSLGSLYSHTGRHEQARRHVEQSLPFYREGGYNKEISQAATIVSHIYDQRGEYAAAAEAFEELVRSARQTGDESQAAEGQLGVGLVLLHRERFAEAIDRFEAALALYWKLGVVQNAGHTLVHRGHAQLQMGRLEESRVSLAEAEGLRARASGHADFNALTSLLAARIALAESRPAAARSEALKAMARAGEKSWAVTAEANYLIALAVSRGGAPGRGSEWSEGAARLAEEKGEPRLLAYALLAQAESLLGAGRAQRAEEAARRALEICERLGQLESAWRAALLAARAARLSGREDEAANYETRSRSLFEQFGRTLPEGASAEYLLRPDVQLFRRQALSGRANGEAARRAG